MKAAAIQLCSRSDRKTNLKQTGELLTKAAANGCNFTLLPENFSFMGEDENEKLAMAEDPSHSEVLSFLSEQAQAHQMLIVGGTVPLQSSEKNKVRNACPVFSPMGKLLTIYDKIHLFDVDLGTEMHCESATVEAGEMPESASVNGWKIGLSICYDLRFPELYRHYSSIGCNILTIPAAFTVPTGRAHWEVLLRARAIENQAYVIAAGQSGADPGGRKTWGHSMIIDPWGDILATLGDEEGIITAELSLNKVKEIREALPALEHRRI